MKSKKKPFKSRKEMRKEKRKELKARKHQIYLHRQQHKKGSQEKSAETPKSNQVEAIIGSKDAKQNTSTYQKGAKSREVESLQKQMVKKRKERLKMDNKLEDRVIKHLEKQLKLNKRKSKAVPKSFATDGLDYLLELCDKDKLHDVVEIGKTMQDSGSEFEDDLALVTGENVKKKKGTKKLEEEVLSEDHILGDDLDDVQSKTSNDSNIDEEEEVAEDVLIEKTEEEEEEDGNIQSEVSEQSMSDDEKDSPSNKKTDEFWEDIYGRTRDSQGNVVASYKPPQLRNVSTSETKNQENLVRLKKQLKGLLNRLATSNVGSIASQVEQIYMSYSRNDMNETLWTLFTESLISEILTPERLIMDHMLLLAVLYANVGLEVGAFFLQTLVKKFIHLLKTKPAVENKEINNVVLCISHLYNFKIFSSLLMYDILNELLITLEEKQVELILLILRTVGFSLRKDDPVALKSLVLKVQSKVNAVSHTECSSRLKFMLEMVLAIKNNNVSKIPNYDPEHVENLKKLLKTLIRKGNYITELKISLQDLLNAEKNGRWWIVGSAWTGALPGERESVPTKVSKQTSIVNSFSQQLLDLAKKQRMNTDTRKNIFCILMSAEDFLDAFEKLVRLGLKGHQEREIVNVILHCCIQEKQFNPYYVHLACKFCSFDRRFQIMLQFAIWDKIKQVKSLTTSQVTVLSKFLAHLVLEKELPLSVLKVIQFSELDKPNIRFVRQVLLSILLEENKETVSSVFSRIVRSKPLKIFREGIRLFIHHFMLRNTKHIPDDKVSLLRERAEMVDKIFVESDSRTIL